MPQLSTDQLMGAFESLRRLDENMPMAQALSLLLIAKYEGLSLKELAEMAGVGMASASRYVSAFGKPLREGSKGLNLVVATEDPMERRKKIIRLTPKGRTFINNLLGA